MAPSAVSMSMSAFLMSRCILRSVLEPLRQTSADLNSANEIRLLIHDMVLAYCSPFLIAISSANRLWYLKHSLPIPPVVVKTKGVNVPCSMSRTQALFLILMHTIDLLRLQVLIRFSIGVANPYIKECRSSLLPEPTCMDIQSRILCFVGSST